MNTNKNKDIISDPVPTKKYNAKNCKMCGKLFSHPHNSICPECLARDEEDFQKVRLFLKEFPGTKLTVVEEYTNVPRKKILQYLRDGRLELAEPASDFLKCSKCGKPIATGMYCPDCYRDFTRELSTIFVNPLKEDKNAKMHLTTHKSLESK